jgi:two-component system cell cycle sensor histidine kinase/response regulator CckA
MTLHPYRQPPMTNGERGAGVAHDLNNIIGVIAGYAELILDRATDDRMRADAAAILRVAHRGASLTQQLLRVETDHGPADVDAVVADIAPGLCQCLGAEIELDLQANPAVAAIGPTALERVVTNLVLNARHAIGPGGHVAVRTRVDADGRYIAVDIVDDGRGLVGEAAQRAFEPRFTTDVKRGNGLGLSTVAAIVREVGGVVTVVSEAGAGTTVRVILPAPFVAASRLGALGRRSSG